MLRELRIRNYAIINNIELQFDRQFNIITGETGAGKSILIGALSLILGARSESGALYNKDEKCIVEGVFNVGSYKLQGFFKSNDLDYDESTILRREILPSGKSRAFINDTPVTLNVLNELSKKLVNIHSQHETLNLNDPDFQLYVIDALADSLGSVHEYRTLYKQYRQKMHQLDQLREAHKQAVLDREYWEFQFNELEKAGLDDHDPLALEAELKKLDHAEDIKRILSEAVFRLGGEEMSALDQINQVEKLLRDTSDFANEFADLYERVKSVRIELDDIMQGLEELESDTEYDPEQIIELRDKLDEFQRLLFKHQLENSGQLKDLKEELNDKLLNIDLDSASLEKLGKECDALRKVLISKAAALSSSRKKAIPHFENKVNTLLEEMGMPSARLKVNCTQLEGSEPGPDGTDKIRFTFSANKGSDFQELRKVASGGELSRLMLSIQSLVAENTALPTLIFDEIDTGVSGEIARKVGSIMQQLAESHQVIAITHLPQIAGKGKTHFYVYKEDSGKQTFTHVRQLTPDERILEIAKMLSGEKPSEAAVANARELLG